MNKIHIHILFERFNARGVLDNDSLPVFVPYNINCTTKLNKRI